MNSDNPHLEQAGPPYEWHTVEIDDTPFIIRDVPEREVELFRVTGDSSNPRVLAQADGVLYNGEVTAPWYEDRCLYFSHDYIGNIGNIYIRDMLSYPALLLERVEQDETVLENL